jgi:hypothetical protein
MSWARTQYLYEYRINKKGAECFRSRDLEATRQKLKELSEKRPGIYTMQSRHCRYEDGCYYLAQDYLGRPQWSIWS